MFEQKNSGGWKFSWAGIVLVVFFVLGVFWVFRQNPPAESTQASSASKAMWSEGKIVEGALEVEAMGFLTFPMNLNKRSTLDAVFSTGDNTKRLAFAIIASADLERWKSGENVQTFTNTGPVPRGTIERVMDPGNYVLIFDNRSGEKAIRIADSDIKVE